VLFLLRENEEESLAWLAGREMELLLISFVLGLGLRFKMNSQKG
jgi:hypothetical protein